MEQAKLHEVIGEWGPYQRRLFIFLSLPLILKGYQVMQSVIVFHVPQHRCQVPGLESDSYVMQGERHRQLVDLTVPREKSTEHGYTQCTVFTLNNASRAAVWNYNLNMSQSPKTRKDSLGNNAQTLLGAKYTKFLSNNGTKMLNDKGTEVLINSDKEAVSNKETEVWKTGANEPVNGGSEGLGKGKAEGILGDSAKKLRNGTEEWMINRTFDQMFNGTSRDFNGSREMEKCSTWVYDLTDFDSSIITQFNLVCDKIHFRSHMNMVYLAGNLLGSPLTGFFCDWFGRKTMFYVSNVLGLVIGVASAFTPSPEVYLVFRFFLGLVGTAIYLSAFVLVVELVGPTWRTTAASLATLLWLSGTFVVAGLTYLVRKWQHIQLIGSAPLALCIIYWWLLPESPRWLLLKNKTEPAMKVIRQVAKCNNLPPPPPLDNIEVNKQTNVQVLQFLRILFRHRPLLVRTLILFLNWGSIGMTYYGLVLNVGNFAGSVRVNFLVSNVSELCGYLLAWFLLERLGRKRSHCCFMLLAGLACLATIFTVAFGGKDIQWATTALAMVGILGISAAYTSIYLITAELFPTIMRNFCLGCCYLVARVGSILSPYVADLALTMEGRFRIAIPLMVFGGLGVLAGVSSLFLPETLHQKLPDTIEDAVSFTPHPKKNSGIEMKEKENGTMTAEEHCPLNKETVSSV